MGKNQHVTPHPAGGWQVKGEGNSKATVANEYTKGSNRSSTCYFEKSGIGIGYSSSEWHDQR